MKARLIEDDNYRYILLCNDGTMAEVDDLLLFDILTAFDRPATYSAGFIGRWDQEYSEMELYPGKTLALIADDLSLTIFNFKPFLPLLNTTVKMRGYISIAEFAKKYNKSAEIIKVYCRGGRIKGAVKIGRDWMIPENADYPTKEFKVGYISSYEFAKRYDKSPQIIQEYCRKGRIQGAIKTGYGWAVPEDAVYPVKESSRKAGRRGPRSHLQK